LSSYGYSLEEQREQAPLPDAHRKTTDVRARTEEARSEVEPPRQKRIDATVPSSKADSPPRLVEPIAEEPATSTPPARATTDQSQSYLSGVIGVIVLIGAVAAFLILQPTQSPIEPMKYQLPPVVEKKAEPPAQVIPPPALPRPAESAVVPKKQEKPVEKQVIANKFAKDIESKKERKAREISSAPSRPIEPVVVPGEQPSPVEEQVTARQPSIPTPEMIRISPGSFRMGGSGKLETPIHTVQLTKPFAIARYETTFDEYDRFARSTGRLWPKDEGWGRESRQVIKVSWDDAKAYVQWLSQQTGHRYRLPTEAEWEYAARSGGKDETWAGTSDESQLKNYAVYDVGRTEPVGSKKPNELNLFDMSGNVREWVEDCEHDYNSAPTDGSTWLERNGGNCHLRVHRGGAWSDRPGRLHVSTRDWDSPGLRYSNIGFRLAQDLP
jgi:formylglycine-generating enzyme required for sulfatase activity